MYFLIQKINNKIVHDFSFTLIQSRPFQKWLKENMSISYRTLEQLGQPGCLSNPDKYIPVGSVEYISKYIKLYYPNATEALRPLNVPEILFPFAGRKIVNIGSDNDFQKLQKMKDVYAKSLDEIKCQQNGPYYDILSRYEPEVFRQMQVSDLIDIQSEWRVFVFHNTIRYMANYAGDCMVFPDAETIIEMVKAYSIESPVTYTLDIAVTKKGETVVIECHRFFSCGLYGYNDYGIYPKMLSQAWFEIKHLNKNGNQ